METLACKQNWGARQTSWINTEFVRAIPVIRCRRLPRLAVQPIIIPFGTVQVQIPISIVMDELIKCTSVLVFLNKIMSVTQLSFTSSAIVEILMVKKPSNHHHHHGWFCGFDFDGGGFLFVLVVFGWFWFLGIEFLNPVFSGDATGLTFEWTRPRIVRF